MTEALLTTLRDPLTHPPLFRTTANSLAQTLAQEIAKPYREKHTLLIPILRAGIALLPPFSAALPKADIGILGIKRDEKTAHPHIYYEKIPPIPFDTEVLLLDPMIATGGTARLALTRLIEHGAEPIHLTLVSVIASRQGLTSIEELHPLVKIKVIAVDPTLSPTHMIVPGLGDFGDRYFGTLA